ncbi:MAG: SURF1 family protein [Alphaproteobacteria bacterium]|nr:SURF1 family protein [Alphaproteobacteria bacterium]
MAVLIGLGTWQVERLVWKRELSATISARTKAPPLALGGVVAHPAAMDYRRVSATGRFDHGRALYLSPRFLDGRPGAHIITPLMRGRLPPVLVNRGWVPLDRKTPATRQAAPGQGPVTVTGIARSDFRRGLFVPDNDAAKGFWIAYDPPAMARAMGIGAPLPLVLEADGAPNPGGLPKGAVTRIDLPNNHLGYALTWYALATALLAVFALAHRPGQGKDS